MYKPASFDMADVHAQISASSILHLVRATDEGLISSVMPFLFDPSVGPHGVIVGHLAKANPHTSANLGDLESLAIITGPDAYISPSSYPSKADDPKVVPTWNYEVIHVHGTLVLHHDPAWKLDLVTRLTERHESRRAEPWAVSDAPVTFIEAKLRAIVGVELQISRIDGKSKLSQNRSATDIAGAAAALAGGTPADVSIAAAMMRREGT